MEAVLSHGKRGRRTEFYFVNVMKLGGGDHEPGTLTEAGLNINIVEGNSLKL